jgi:MoaA/NifB/PqqE/SkfB family radical SAM enzyme
MQSLHASAADRLTPHPLKFSEIRIENTNRCGYHCFFCPREELTRPQGVMPLEDLSLILDRVGYHEGLVDLHGFGEPLLDKLLLDKVALLTSRWPKAEPRFYSTLGVRVRPDYFSSLAAAGLRHVEVSFYGFDAESYLQAHGADRYEAARENLTRLCEVQREAAGRLNVVVRAFPKHDAIKQPGVNAKRLEDFHQWLEGLGVTLWRERELHNYGSGRDYNEPGKDIPCSVVWGYRRRVLQITWDLHVIPCCFDFNAEVELGTLRLNTLEEIFNGRAYTDFIESHIANRLENYPVCVKCERCYRE